VKLFRCRLEGPQQSLPDAYVGAVALSGSGDPALEKSHNAALAETVIVSGRAGGVLPRIGARRPARANLVGAGNQAPPLLPGAGCKGRTAMQVSLERVTLAVKSAAIRLGDAPAAGVPADPILVQSKDCVYQNPFPGNAGKATILVYEGDALPRGLLLWRGQ